MDRRNESGSSRRNNDDNYTASSSESPFSNGSDPSNTKPDSKNHSGRLDHDIAHEQTPLLSHNGQESNPATINTNKDNSYNTGGRRRAKDMSTNNKNHVGVNMGDDGVADREQQEDGDGRISSISGQSGRRDRDQPAQDRDRMRPPPLTRERLNRWNRIYSRSVKVVAAVLFGCLLVVVLSPWVAQRVLDQAMVLDIQQASIYDMDQTGFQISIQSTIYLDPTHDGVFGLTRTLQSVFHPTMTIEPSVLHLSLPTDRDDVHMAEFEVERQHMQMGETLQLNLSTHVTVTDANRMAQFFHATLHQSIVDLAIRGPILTRLGSLWYMKLRINQVVPMDGMKGVQNATLVSMSLPADHPQGGIVMTGLAQLNNPSRTVSIKMDAVTFGIYLPSMAHPEVDQFKIAEMSCPELNLEAGKASQIALSGRLFHLDDWILSEMGMIGSFGSGSEKQLLLGRLLSRFIQGQDSTIQVRAMSKDPNVPPWLVEAFKSIVLDMAFPGSPAQDFIRALDMNQLEFGFSDNQELAMLSGRMSTGLQLPPNVTFPIKILQMKPTAWLKTPEGQDMALLEMPDFLPTKSHQDGSALEVYVDIRDIPLRIVADHLDEFYKFLNTSFTKEWLELGIAGEAHAVVECGLGTFELGPIPFDVITRQRGLGGLVSVPPLLESLDVVDSTEHSLTVKATLVLWNPSNISADLGDLSFLWSYGGYLIGMASVPQLQLHAGNNTIECIGMMDPSIHCLRKHDKTCDPELARNASREFISKYISGDNSTSIDVLGYPGSTHIPLLQPMLSSFSISSGLPAIEDDFLISTTMYLLSSTIVLELKNPLDTAITVLYINGTAFYKDEPLGHVNVDFEHDIVSPKPILIPANDHQNETSGYVKTPKLPVMFDLSSVGYEALKKALGGTLEVDVSCHIKAKVGSMLMWVDFAKDGIQSNVKKGF
ncbi:hypothetical protein BGZ97_004996 [Linnemannia gamsii]|uniref:Tag1-like fifth Ig-like domain-containing protein n=1 Tax=Linnemannia gamsii TaxID=64522 RepID=A0A9P6QTH5_9FUNG|nr:hypothetical protein BGZ97_004996 [Linnemannia gamsii]